MGRSWSVCPVRVLVLVPVQGTLTCSLCRHCYLPKAPFSLKLFCSQLPSSCWLQTCPAAGSPVQTLGSHPLTFTLWGCFLTALCFPTNQVLSALPAAAFPLCVAQTPCGRAKTTAIWGSTALGPVQVPDTSPLSLPCGVAGIKPKSDHCR